MRRSASCGCSAKRFRPKGRWYLSLSESLVGVQSPQLLVTPADVHDLDAASGAIELAESIGGDLDEAQCLSLETMMGRRKDGTWAASQYGEAESRQNGKGDIIQWRELFGASIMAEPIIHTAHEYPTANKAFLRIEPYFLNFDELRRGVKKVRYAHGDQGIELLNGGSISYKARTGGGGRGFDGIAVVVYDEAQHAQEEHMAASSPTMAVHPNPQAIFAGSAGLATSVVWWKMRKRALLAVARAKAGLPSIDPRFAFSEHTAEQIWCDVTGKIERGPRPGPLNRAAWAMANPAYGVRISDDFLLSQLGLLGDDLFLREHCGVWDVPLDDRQTQPTKLPADEWLATGVTRKRKIDRGEVTVAYDVDKDGQWSSISVGAGSLQAPYVEVIEHRQGVGWLPARLVELVKRWEPTVAKGDDRVIGIGCNGAGPAGGQVGSILATFAASGVGCHILQMNSNEYKQACGGFYTDVIEGRLKRPAKGQGPLDVAAADAAERPLGDAWAWDRRNATVPVSPLVGATIARALLPVTAPDEEVEVNLW